LTEIVNCTFETKRRAVAFKGNTIIRDCTFNNGTWVATYDIHTGVKITITRSRFNGGGVITSVWRDCQWEITDCEFAGGGPGRIGIANGAAGTSIKIDKCRFSGSWKRGIRAAGGSFFITNTDFQGAYAEGAIVYDDSSGDIGQLIVDKCTFKNTGRSIWAQNGSSGKIKGSNNFFAARLPEARRPARNNNTTDPAVAVQDMYQGLELRQGAAPEALVSGEVIAPSFNFDRYRVTGAGRITSIKIGGSEDVTRMCAGRLVLVAEGGWALSEGGNIRPLTVGARKVGEVVTLVRDAQAGLWVEVRNETGRKL
jgi:hypothetical protein